MASQFVDDTTYIAELNNAESNKTLHEGTQHFIDVVNMTFIDDDEVLVPEEAFRSAPTQVTQTVLSPGLLDEFDDFDIDLELEQSAIDKLFEKNSEDEEAFSSTQALVSSLMEDVAAEAKLPKTPAVYPTYPEEFNLKAWGIPSEVAQVYEDNGVKSLYPWQVGCLQLPEVTQSKKNLVYCAPTNGGKTMGMYLHLTYD